MVTFSTFTLNPLLPSAGTIRMQYLTQFRSVVSEEKIFKGFTLNFLYSHFVMFCSQCRCYYILRNFKFNTYSKDYSSKISKNYIQ